MRCGITTVTTFGRYFLALAPDDAARDRLLAIGLPDGARPVHPLDLHLTLAFVGSLEPDGEARILQAIDPGPPVSVHLDRLSYWPGPRVLCATAGEAPELDALARRLLSQLQGAGVRVDTQPFRAHVTLARGAKLPPAADVPLPAPILWRATAVQLMASLGGTREASAATPRYQQRGSRACYGGGVASSGQSR